MTRPLSGLRLAAALPSLGALAAVVAVGAPACGAFKGTDSSANGSDGGTANAGDASNANSSDGAIVDGGAGHNEAGSSGGDAAPADASADGGTLVPFACSLNPAALLCDDFDELNAMFGSQWVTPSHTTGALILIDQMQAQSTPQSLHAATLNAGAESAFVQSVALKPTTSSAVTIAFSIYIDVAPMFDVWQVANVVYASSDHFITLGSNGFIFNGTGAGGAGTRVWHRVQLQIANNQATLTVDKTVGPASPISAFPTFEVALGLHTSTEVGNVFIDDVLVTSP
jgi:hypothetical protein